MQRGPNLRFFPLECILYAIHLCPLWLLELIFLAFDGCFACSQDVDNRCGDSHWRAANNHGRKAAKLDESGLEIAGCRHGLAQWAVNIFQGELYVYANFIHKKKMIPAGVKYLWEDIVCKYWKWAGKAGGLENCDMKPALSVMQAKAHSWRCQKHRTSTSC
ncbi:uncharacterized protein LOC111345948 [Stylophora pistillata]|uniref:uncharacterized protein LOC111345948 n=1 Tax=Stylophora pistillata TaxID=50429 RepID=UPI000C056D55|nr:uncharacterized protein LOC111345948 [Stylophora pistillata]